MSEFQGNPVPEQKSVHANDGDQGTQDSRTVISAKSDLECSVEPLEKILQMDMPVVQKDPLIRGWFHQQHKAELHLHLTGAIPRDAFFELVRRRRPHTHHDTRSMLDNHFRTSNFRDFLRLWVWKNQFITCLDDFRFLSEAVARSLLEQNILWADCFFSPRNFMDRGLDFIGMLEAIQEGFSRVPGVHIALVLDPGRDYGGHAAFQLLKEWRKSGSASQTESLNTPGAQSDTLPLIQGVGLGGREDHVDPAEFADFFNLARDWGLCTTAHAGEFSGSDYIERTLTYLKPQRLGHALSLVDSPELMDQIRAEGIHIESCPGSNLRTGAARSLSTHPLLKLLTQGISCSVNTDDPLLFSNSLADEFIQLLLHTPLTASQACFLLHQARERCFAYKYLYPLS